MKEYLTIIRQIDKIANVIYQLPYDELTDYLKGIRDMINLLNGEEGIDPDERLIDFIVEEMKKIDTNIQIFN